jgi:crossover junction endodeoxyribonuclease RuvC
MTPFGRDGLCFARLPQANPFRQTDFAGITQGVIRPSIRILGIDPGLRRTGWGLVACEGNRLTYVACGTVETDAKAALAERLVAIYEGLDRIVTDFRPDEAAVEATFVNRDAVATLKLGQARGIALLVPARAGVPVSEYAPNLVKKTIVGAGHGEKAQIRMMIGVLLPRADPQSEDAADALAIAVTHAHHRQSLILKVAAE